MKINPNETLITVSIQDCCLVVNVISTETLPRCYVSEIPRIPLECTAWINILEHKKP